MKVLHEAHGLGAIDEILQDGRPVERGTAIRSGSSIVLRGWALTADRRPWTELHVVVDGIAYPAIAHDIRADRAVVAGPSAVRAGFFAHVRIDAAQPVEMRIYGRHDGAFVPCGPATMLVVEADVPVAHGPEPWASYVDGIREHGVGTEIVFDRPDENGALTLADGAVAVLEVWAVNLARPNEPVRLDASRDGVRIPVADRIARPDVMDFIAGMTTPFCAFLIPLTPPLGGVATLNLVASMSDGSAHQFAPIHYRAAGNTAAIVSSRTARFSGSIDRVEIFGRPQPRGMVVHANRGESMTVHGWAFAVDDALLPDRVMVELGADRAFLATTGIARPDVAANLGNPLAATAGYEGTAEMLDVPAGRHTCRVVAYDDRRAEASPLGEPFFVNVEAN